MTASCLLSGAISLGLTLILTPLVRNICLRLGICDLPGPLKIHAQPIPRLGGIAIAIGLAAGICSWTILTSNSGHPFLPALAVIWIAGLADDLGSISWFIRLVAQICAATLLWYGGCRLPWIGDSAVNWIFTTGLVIFFVNSVNFLDGTDGLAASVSAVIAASYLALPGGYLSPLGDVVASSILGTCAGFLVSNLPPAKLFMGDNGSTILGMGLSFLGLDFCRAGPSTKSPIIFPVLVAAIPLLDVILAIVRRLRNRVPIWKGDRFHFYDAMLARGCSSRNVVVFSSVLTFLMAAAARLSMLATPGFASLICLVCLSGLLAGALKLGLLKKTSLERTTR